MIMLYFLTEDMNIFGDLATSDLFTLMKSQNASIMPKAILKPNLGTDSIQKCLWILCKRSTFRPQKKLNIKYFQCLKCSLTALIEIKFPMLISVESKLATYHHVVVVWREMVIDVNLCICIPYLRIHWGKFAQLILHFNKLAVDMASYIQQFAKHLRQIRIFRTVA